MIHNDHFPFLEAKISIFITLVVSLLKINALDDYMHGVWTAIGGLTVTLIYSVCKYFWQRYKKRKSEKE